MAQIAWLYQKDYAVFLTVFAVDMRIIIDKEVVVQRHAIFRARGNFKAKKQRYLAVLDVLPSLQCGEKYICFRLEARENVLSIPN